MRRNIKHPSIFSHIRKITLFTRIKMDDVEVFSFIEGENVNLLPLNSEHIKLYVKWENNPNVRRYSRNTFPMTVEEYKKRFKPEKTSAKTRILFEIWHKKDKKPIGFAEIHDISWLDRRALIGLLIGETEYWGQNLATEAGKLLIAYGFKELNLNKIYTAIFSPNIASWRCAEKIGMTREAVLKDHIYIDGKYYDDFKYCIFREQWLKQD